MQIQNFIRKGSKQRLAQAAMEYAIGYLGLSKNKATIALILSKNQIKETGANGVTGPADGMIVVSLDANLHIDKMLHTLMHEMIHVKQLAKGIMTYTRDAEGNERWTWQGKEIAGDKHYLTLPWELQAFRETEILYRRFAAFMETLEN